MAVNNLKRRLKNGDAVYGIFLKLTDPAVVEIAGLAGFDFVIIDTEHGPISIETAQNLVRAAQIREITSIIRVSENEPNLILRSLDIGACGVQVPQVSTKEDAIRAVSSAKYFPDGNRGVCRFVRAAGYSSIDKNEYFQKSNEETLVIVHIEGLDGISNLSEILTVKDLDIIFLGPYDLSQSCGIPGQIEHPDVLKKMEESVRLAKKSGVTVGTFVETVESAKKWVDIGVQYISFSVDVGIFFNACSDIVKGVRGPT
ncbi:HpcH/HpaI aldolase/citrate lyase family protein [candidate division KSB1 bacterium]